MEVEIKIQGQNLSSEKDIISFSFRKNLYKPYTMLDATFITTAGYNNVKGVYLYIGGKMIHHGLIDKFTESVSGGVKRVRVVSRGFTSLLLQNQISAGRKDNISLNSLMTNYNIPYVTHEDNSDSQNYIYIDKTSTMWDGIVTLSYKLCGTYPFISGDNCVRITPKPQPAHFDCRDISAYGVMHDYSDLISHYDMPDISGNYGTYHTEDTEIVGLDIVRHKYIDLDPGFLHNPIEALYFRQKVSSKGMYADYCEYAGYSGEDLTDTVTFGNISGRIGLIEVKGGSAGILSRIGVYKDKFH